ncbi:hypothetical protein U9M48_011476 [Paspalum notatum var. saurae]|uniref:F-box domain-containing protein n=1 Tax=Paspalum notatum var. saurae TaxID=547442 RepID=A0AAQ3SVP9_PASNO
MKGDKARHRRRGRHRQRYNNKQAGGSSSDKKTPAKTTTDGDATALSDLPDHLLAEILVRVSPLGGFCNRAPRVCKTWRRIVSHDSGFRRRYHALHREAILAIQEICIFASRWREEQCLRTKTAPTTTEQRTPAGLETQEMITQQPEQP